MTTSPAPTTALTTRQRIQAALEDYHGWPVIEGWAGVVAYAAEPDVRHPGAAWPVKRELRPGVLCAPYAHTYDVYLVLDNTYGPWSAELADALDVPLTEALTAHGWEWIPPTVLEQTQFGTEVMPTLRCRITPDSDT